MQGVELCGPAHDEDIVSRTGDAETRPATATSASGPLDAYLRQSSFTSLNSISGNHMKYHVMKEWVGE